MVIPVSPPISPAEPGKIAGPGSLLHAGRVAAANEVAQQRATAAKAPLSATQRSAVRARAAQLGQTVHADAANLRQAVHGGASASTIKSAASTRVTALASKVAADEQDLHGAETRSETGPEAGTATSRGGSVNRSA